jgi:hypothetical protein
MTREHPVHNDEVHARAVSEYRRDGYRITSTADGATTLEYYSRGSLLAHLALFFTVGWLTLGILNWWYAHRKKKATHDRVEVVTG